MMKTTPVTTRDHHIELSMAIRSETRSGSQLFAAKR